MDARQEYIRAAVSFLQNPKLSSTSLKDKLKFLKDKGLSEFEVDEALNLAVNRQQPSNGSTWNFFIILGACAMGYRLYKMYLETQKPEPEQPKVEPTNQTDVKDLLIKMGELRRLMESEMKTIKALLLSHEKFAPAIPAWQLKDQENEDD